MEIFPKRNEDKVLTDKRIFDIDDSEDETLFFYDSECSTDKVKDIFLMTVHELNYHQVHLFVQACLVAMGLPKRKLIELVNKPSFSDLLPYLDRHWSSNGKINYSALNLLGHCYTAAGLRDECTFISSFRKKIKANDIWLMNPEDTNLKGKQLEKCLRKRKKIRRIDASRAGMSILNRMIMMENDELIKAEESNSKLANPMQIIQIIEDDKRAEEVKDAIDDFVSAKKMENEANSGNLSVRLLDMSLFSTSVDVSIENTVIAKQAFSDSVSEKHMPDIDFSRVISGKESVFENIDFSNIISDSDQHKNLIAIDVTRPNYPSISEVDWINRSKRQFKVPDDFNSVLKPDDSIYVFADDQYGTLTEKIKVSEVISVENSDDELRKLKISDFRKEIVIHEEKRDNSNEGGVRLLNIDLSNFEDTTAQFKSNVLDVNEEQEEEVDGAITVFNDRKIVYSDSVVNPAFSSETIDEKLALSTSIVQGAKAIELEFSESRKRKFSEARSSPLQFSIDCSTPSAQETACLSDSDLRSYKKMKETIEVLKSIVSPPEKLSESPLLKPAVDFNVEYKSTIEVPASAFELVNQTEDDFELEENLEIKKKVKEDLNALLKDVDVKKKRSRKRKQKNKPEIVGTISGDKDEDDPFQISKVIEDLDKVSDKKFAFTARDKPGNEE